MRWCNGGVQGSGQTYICMYMYMVLKSMVFHYKGIKKVLFWPHKNVYKHWYICCATSSKGWITSPLHEKGSCTRRRNSGATNHISRKNYQHSDCIFPLVFGFFILDFLNLLTFEFPGFHMHDWKACCMHTYMYSV